ncbi:hypothetical protein ACLOJK_017236 [Asimina triloba]
MDLEGRRRTTASLVESCHGRSYQRRTLARGLRLFGRDGAGGLARWELLAGGDGFVGVLMGFGKGVGSGSGVEIERDGWGYTAMGKLSPAIAAVSGGRGDARCRRHGRGRRAADGLAGVGEDGWVSRRSSPPAAMAAGLVEGDGAPYGCSGGTP